ncbi:hypothetical protein ACFE04_022945 [Oxalis oulophora]
MLSPTSSSPLSLSQIAPPPLVSPNRHRATFIPPRATHATTYPYPSSDQNKSSQNMTNNFSYLSTMSTTATTANCSSLYDVLGLTIGATPHEIKKAYRNLARTLHPDVVKDSSANEFLKIQAAYSTLSDPEKRAVYDRKMLRRQNIPRPLTFSGRDAYRGRSWETDQCW